MADKEIYQLKLESNLLEFCIGNQLTTSEVVKLCDTAELEESTKEICDLLKTALHNKSLPPEMSARVTQLAADIPHLVDFAVSMKSNEAVIEITASCPLNQEYIHFVMTEISGIHKERFWGKTAMMSARITLPNNDN